MHLLNEEGKQKYLPGTPLLPYQKLTSKFSPYYQHFDAILVSAGDDYDKKQCVLRCRLCQEDISPANPSRTKWAHANKEGCKKQAAAGAECKAAGSPTPVKKLASHLNLPHQRRSTHSVYGPQGQMGIQTIMVSLSF